MQQQSTPLSLVGSGGRVDLYSGSSTSVNISVPTTVNVLYVSFDLDGRGITQLMFDLQEAVTRGDVRLYNRGGGRTLTGPMTPS